MCIRVGQSAGALVGGWLCKQYGIESAFKKSAVVYGGIFGLYLIYTGIKIIRNNSKDTNQEKLKE